MTTDDGFCCVFNAVEQTELLKANIDTSRYVHNVIPKRYKVPQIASLRFYNNRSEKQYFWSSFAAKKKYLSM